MREVDERIIKFIVDYYKKNQFYPNYDEIAEGVNKSKAGVFTCVKRLEDEGIVIRKSECSSQYRLVNMDFIRSSGLVGEVGEKGNHEKKLFTSVEESPKLGDQGMLLRLPFKIGDTAYLVRYGMAAGEYEISDSKIYEIDIYDYGVCFKCEGQRGFFLEDFGRIAFAKRKEAIARIEEVGGKV